MCRLNVQSVFRSSTECFRNIVKDLFSKEQLSFQDTEAAAVDRSSESILNLSCGKNA